MTDILHHCFARVRLVTSSLSLPSQGHYYYYYQYSARRPGLAGTRAQSGDRYGSGTLHSRQFLRGWLPLLSPAFRRSHFRLQVPPRASNVRDLYQRKTELRARTGRSILPVKINSIGQIPSLAMASTHYPVISLNM